VVVLVTAAVVVVVKGKYKGKGTYTSYNLKSNLKTIYKVPVSGAESEALGYRYARQHRLLRISQF